MRVRTRVGRVSARPGAFRTPRCGRSPRASRTRRRSCAPRRRARPGSRGRAPSARAASPDRTHAVAPSSHDCAISRGARLERVRGDDLGDESPVERLGGGERARGQREFERAPRADGLGQQGADAAVGRERDIRVPARERRALGGDDDVGDEHEAEPAAGDGPLHGGHDRLRALAERAVAVVDRVGERRDRRRPDLAPLDRRGRELGHRAHVAARAERAAVGVEEHRADVVALGDLVRDRLPARDRVGVDRVQPVSGG